MTTKVQWKHLDTSNGPKPRHGHRAVAIKDLIIIFGGGNDGIVEELNVFNCATNQWFQPSVKGDIPIGCAAFGFATDGLKILVFGGMIEYGKYSGDLWELNPITWHWKKIKPKLSKSSSLPCARLGHTLTYIEGKYYLFGGLANDSKDPKQNVPRYLNDLYTLEYKSSNYSWDQLIVRGTQPIERESHSCVSYRGQIENHSKLIIYGGMNGHRLGDIWSFYLDSLQWIQITPSGLAPQPRSLHSSVIIGHRMFVFGGWIPLISSDKHDQNTNEKEWKCTNTLAALNLETNTWELLGQECVDEDIPRARAGHCAVAVNTRMYIWSGRDGYRKAWNNQVCCKDLWYLETACPGEPEKVQLLKAGIGNLEVIWNPLPTADSYILQIQRCETPIDSSTTSANLPSVSLQSIFASKSPQSVLASLIPTFSHEQQSSIFTMSDNDDQCLSQSTLLNKSTSDLSTLTHLSPSHTSSMITVNSPTTLNSTTNSSIIFHRPISTNVSSHSTSTIRPTTSSNIQFLNTTSNSNIRPINFHQNGTTTSTQPQLLTVMPAGVHIQQLTPVAHSSSTQPTTIVRLMSPKTTGQQQLIQLNTPKQQPLIVKAISTSTSNRQPILLTSNTQSKVNSSSMQQSILVLNQNTTNNIQNQQAKIMLSTANINQSNMNYSQQEITTKNNHLIPQTDGLISLEIFSKQINQITTIENILERVRKDISLKHDNNFIPQIDGSIDDQSLQNETTFPLQNTTEQQTITTNTQSSSMLRTASVVVVVFLLNKTYVLKDNHKISQTIISNSHTKMSTLENDDNKWHLVGTFKTTTVDIKHYYIVKSKVDLNNYDLASLQAQNLVKKVDLESGVIYKLRIAAVNSCGRGPWSEVAAFKTCLPGAPPAPSNIKITKTSDGGAHLTWDFLSSPSCLITGYAVYLAVKNTSTDNTLSRQHQQQASQMAFVRVYGGVLAECFVNASQLLQAHLDTSSSSKPAIIFRIAARNERGYGPATQVRWLQDQQQMPLHNSTTNNSLKRIASNTNSTTKRSRLIPTGGGSNDT